MESYKLIEADYRCCDNDDDTLRTLKEAMGYLNAAQRKIWLTYVELGSYAAVAREYNVSLPTAKSYIMEVKKILTEIYDGLSNDSADCRAGI